MSAILDLDRAGDGQLTDTTARRLLAGPLGQRLRELVIAEESVRFARTDIDDGPGDVYYADLIPLAADADLYALDGRGGHAVTADDLGQCLGEDA